MREEKFTDIYQNNLWGSKETKSGLGSELKNTITMLENLPKIIEKYKIKSILDVGCGDWNWFKEMDIDTTYTGIDIVEPLIEELNKKHKNNNIEFIHSDAIEEKFRNYDMVIARDVLFHFSYKDIFKFMSNLQESQSKYFLTTHSGDFINKDIETGDWRPINLFAKPFNFPTPIYSFKDNNGTRDVCLFKII
tara:strand:+ start:2151 stop:2726 length:576 start_codon:yes stop_codon:yes gene_type:complete